MGSPMTMLQDEREISALAELFAREGVRSYLEIGSKFGGSLRRIGNSLPTESRIVAVDLPQGTKAWPQSRISLEKEMSALARLGFHDCHLVWGNSQSADVIEKVRALGPFDAVLIDADHRLPGVTADWNNYGPMGRLVAFHDVAWQRAPDWVGTRIDVPEFWNSIKGGYRHEEFKFCPTGKNNGIGVLWRE
jgi:predicted O-methyltransferase YrrM